MMKAGPWGGSGRTDENKDDRPGASMSWYTITGRSTTIFDELTDILIAADIGISTATAMVSACASRCARSPARRDPRLLRAQIAEPPPSGHRPRLASY